MVMTMNTISVAFKSSSRPHAFACDVGDIGPASICHGNMTAGAVGELRCPRPSQDLLPALGRWECVLPSSIRGPHHLPQAFLPLFLDAIFPSHLGIVSFSNFHSSSWQESDFALPTPPKNSRRPSSPPARYRIIFHHIPPPEDSMSAAVTKLLTNTIQDFPTPGSVETQAWPVDDG